MHQVTFYSQLMAIYQYNRPIYYNLIQFPHKCYRHCGRIP